MKNKKRISRGHRTNIANLKKSLERYRLHIMDLQKSNGHLIDELSEAKEKIRLSELCIHGYRLHIHVNPADCPFCIKNPLPGQSDKDKETEQGNLIISLKEELDAANELIGLYRRVER